MNAPSPLLRFCRRALLAGALACAPAVRAAPPNAPVVAGPAAAATGRGCEAVLSRVFPSMEGFVRDAARAQGWEPAGAQRAGAWRQEKRVDKPPFGRVALGSVKNPDSATSRRDLFLVAERQGEVLAFGPVATERAGAGFNEGVAVARLSVVPAGSDAILWVELVDTTVMTGAGDEEVRRLAFVFTARPELRCAAAGIPLTEISKTEGVVQAESSIIVSFPAADVMRVAAGKGTASDAQRSWLGTTAVPAR